MSFEYIDKNLEVVRDKINAAAKQAKRTDLPIIIAVIKGADTKQINYITDCCGICDVGENRVQQLTERYDAIKRDNVRIHFIGKLQKNKVKYIIDKVYMIHSVDNLALASEIDKRAAAAGIIMKVLLEINSGCEENKSGVIPSDVEELALELVKFSNIELCGFMTMAPRCENNEEYLKFFSETVKLSLDIWQKTLHNIGRPILSMGMSESFEKATECGATCVRLGRCLFKNK